MTFIQEDGARGYGACKQQVGCSLTSSSPTSLPAPVSSLLFQLQQKRCCFFHGGSCCLQPGSWSTTFLGSSTVSLPLGLCAASPSLPVLGLSMTTSTHLMHLKNSNNSNKSNKLPLDPVPFLALLPSQPKLEKEDMCSPATFSLPFTLSAPSSRPLSAFPFAANATKVSVFSMKWA